MYNNAAMTDLFSAVKEFEAWDKGKSVSSKTITTPMRELIRILDDSNFKLNFRVVLGTYRISWKPHNSCWDACDCPYCDNRYVFFYENLENDRAPMQIDKFEEYEPDFHVENFFSQHIDAIQAKIYQVIEEVRKNREEEVALQHNRMREIEHADRAMAVLSGDLPLKDL